MRPEAHRPHEAWGVLNPGGVRGPDGSMHLFPRFVDSDNRSRIGHARVHDVNGIPERIQRLGIALEPVGPDEASGCEDARVTYVPLLKRYIMTYTAVGASGPRVAIAVSHDLRAWTRFGPVSYDDDAEFDFNRCGNKDAALFRDVIFDPEGVPSFGLLHRPTIRDTHGYSEHVWLSYISVEAVLENFAQLTTVRRHERILAPEQSWESDKVGTGAPPVRVPYGWLLPYHAASTVNGHSRSCMGMAVLDLERPTHVLYRTPLPVLEPLTQYERNESGPTVVFPTAAHVQADGALGLFYGAADRVIAAARVTIPDRLPAAVELLKRS